MPHLQSSKERRKWQRTFSFQLRIANQIHQCDQKRPYCKRSLFRVVSKNTKYHRRTMSTEQPCLSRLSGLSYFRHVPAARRCEFGLVFIRSGHSPSQVKISKSLHRFTSRSIDLLVKHFCMRGPTILSILGSLLSTNSAITFQKGSLSDPARIMASGYQGPVSQRTNRTICPSRHGKWQPGESQ
jgi:hypothetical protein